jgi:hypothetical protein
MSWGERSNTGWSEAWHESVGSRVSVVLDDQRVVEGEVIELWPTVPCMKIRDDDGQDHFTHPRYARPVWTGGQP